MKRIALLMILLLASPVYALEETRSYFPPIIMYHDIKAVTVNAFDVSIKDFAQQLDILQEEGYMTLSLEEFASCLRDGRDFPDKSVLITLDDGYRGIYRYAVPELRRRNMKATFFITSDTVGILNSKYPHVTHEELRDMASDDLFSIGSHTATHPDLYTLTHDERLKEFRESKAKLEAMTGRNIFALAYPKGNYDAEIIAEVKEAGYDLAFAVQDRGLLNEPARYTIPRIYTGVELGRDNHKLFREYLASYKDMPAEAFTERWRPLTVSYDVIVAGGGTGGISAAIQASRMGTSVLVVEPSGMLGGQATAAGVSTMDDMSGIESGIYHEFMDRVRRYYAAKRKSISTCYWKTYGKAFEPSVGHNILAGMAESVDVLYYSNIISLKDNVATITTPEGTKTIGYKILIDATEYGDILPMAGAHYRAGNSILPGELKDTMIQDITWTAVIRKYTDGVPQHLKPKEPLPGYDKAKKNYAGYISRNGFDFQGKYPVKMPVNFATHNAYRAIPDSYSRGSYTGAKSDWKRITKTGVNWGNDYPGMYLWHGRYGLPVAYLESMDLRAEIEREALMKTLHFIYYIQNELKESWSVDENEYNDLPQYAKDLPEEWQEIARHIPPIPYVRESRRAVGNWTLNSKALRENSMSYRNGIRNNEFTDAIAIGGYNLDLHGGDDDDDIESGLGEKQSSIWGDTPKGPFQVPMRILIPASTDNLIAAEKNLSMSRLASGALRLQPITMMTGQAAGALAAMAVSMDVQPQDVKAVYVQKVLADNGVRLSLCRYSDVPEHSQYYGSIQIATLYRLLEPRVYPDIPASNINTDKKKGRNRGRFGINDAVSEKEFAAMIARAEEIIGEKLLLKEHEGRLTRGEAVDMVVNAMCATSRHKSD